jgi:hypothetical protein
LNEDVDGLRQRRVDLVEVPGIRDEVLRHVAAAVGLVILEVRVAGRHSADGIERRIPRPAPP